MKNKLQSLQKVFISFLAIAFLFITTACNSAELSADATGPNPTRGGGKTEVNVPNPTKGEQNAQATKTKGLRQEGQITELYKPITPAEGGMNTYSDVDPRQNTAKADSKAARNIQNANSELKPGNNPIKEVKKELDKKGVKERVDELSSDVSRKAQDKVNEVSKTAQKGLDNLQGNTKSFKQDVGSAAENVSDKVGNKADDIKSSVRQTAEKVADKVKS
jgi:hypothetical protein